MKFIFGFLGILFWYVGASQVAVNNFNKNEKLYLITVNQLVDYLRSKPLVGNQNTGSNQNTEAFYSHAIDSFFDKEIMLKSFEKDTNVFAVSGKLDIIRHLLYSVKNYLDIQSTDSIFITPVRYTIKHKVVKTDSEFDYITNSLLTYTFLKNIKVDLLIVYFNEKTKKILSISPFVRAVEENSFLNQKGNKQ